MERPAKFAAYLDEAGEEPDAACKVLLEHQIYNAALRNAWTGSVCKLSDPLCKKLRDILSDNGIKPLLLISDLGRVDAATLMQTSQADIDRVFNLAAYFRVDMVRVGLGYKSRHKCDLVVDEWMRMIVSRCVSSGLVPVVELSFDDYYIQPVDLVPLLKKHKRWKVLYDPATLLVKRNVDHFTKYWPLLKDFVAAIDVHDFKIGRGHKPAGIGDCKLNLMARDMAGSNCWFILEPALGKRYGSAITRRDTFKIAMDGVDIMLND